MGRLLIALILLVVSAMTAAAQAERSLAQQECDEQWQGLSLFQELCIAHDTAGWKRLEQSKLAVSSVEGGVAAASRCAANFPASYQAQIQCIDGEMSPEFCDFHGTPCDARMTEADQ